jgi:hypothetical protein
MYDVLGREIVRLVEGYREVGHHSATWNASDQASGVYFARLSVKNRQGVQTLSRVVKLVLMR